MDDARRRLRLDRHTTVGRALESMPDRALRDLVESAPVLATGSGGTAALLQMESGPVFVKRVLLTDLEPRPGHAMTTANLFGLPVGCHYGVGSPGFGGWRGLAANTIATTLVLDGSPDRAQLHDELADLAVPGDEPVRPVDQVVVRLHTPWGRLSTWYVVPNCRSRTNKPPWSPAYKAPLAGSQESVKET